MEIHPFTVSETNDSLKITFNSRLDQIEPIVTRSVGFFDKHGVEINHFGLKLVLFEALMNASKHGNDFNESLVVILSIKLAEPEILITINDQGKGFDWKTCIKKKEQAVDKSGGRGILLFKLYGYHPSYNECGNELILHKNLLEKEELHP